MAYVDHPNIVKLYEVYDGKNKFHMVLELMTGGELFDRIVDKDHYSEQEAQEVIKPLVDAISYCHKLGIVHRDLKVKKKQSPIYLMWSVFWDLDFLVLFHF